MQHSLLHDPAARPVLPSPFAFFTEPNSPYFHAMPRCRSCHPTSLLIHSGLSSPWLSTSRLALILDRAPTMHSTAHHLVAPPCRPVPAATCAVRHVELHREPVYATPLWSSPSDVRVHLLGYSRPTTAATSPLRRAIAAPRAEVHHRYQGLRSQTHHAVRAPSRAPTAPAPRSSCPG
jgi:hypothetical protein